MVIQSRRISKNVVIVCLSYCPSIHLQKDYRISIAVISNPNKIQTMRISTTAVKTYRCCSAQYPCETLSLKS